MGLSKSRIHPGAETLYPWEREAIDFVLGNEKLPDVDPYQAWPLQEFTDPATGRLYELDLLFLGRHVLYLIEIKSHPGILRGDARDWSFEDPKSGRRWALEHPYPLANAKAKALKALLERELKGRCPRVEALIFVSAPDLQNKLSSGRERVVDRKEVAEALTHGTRLDDRLKRSLVDRPTMREVTAALHKLGLRASQVSRLVGEYQLGALLDEDETYQEHLGKHRAIEGRTARVRTYLVPRATSPERQAQLRRAARREAEILSELGDHPGILRSLDYVEAAPPGPSLLFEGFDGGVPLDLFLRRRKDQGNELSFDERLALIERVAEALEHCHRKGVLHRNLEPRSVLVRQGEGGAAEVRLHRFHLAMHEEGSTSGTAHLSAFQGVEARVYSAPEVLDDPAKATAESDVFSLGALAYFILSGQPPAGDLAEHDRRLAGDKGLLLSRVRDDFSRELVEAVRMATDPMVASRADSAMEWCQLLLEEATRPPPEGPPQGKDPYEARPGEELDGTFTVERVLGSGSTARVLKVEDQEGRPFALKIPHDERYVARLQSEADVLGRLRHQHIVQSHGMRRVGGRECLLLDFAAERTLAGLLREEGTVGLDYARRFGEDLLGVVQYLEEQGVQHRDIKPSNIGFTPDDKQAKHLILFDFSLSQADPSAVTAGTAAYRDPFLRRRGQWDAAADRYAAAVTLYQMLTGALPSVGGEGAGEGGSPVRMEAERFDASVRDRLISFFERAFEAEVGRRFPSAEAMRWEWNGVFEAAPSPVARPAPGLPPSEGMAAAPGEPPLPSLESVTLETAVEGLPLSSRARNALDRAGVMQVRELLQLPRNHLSAVRGVGRKVAKEIQQIAARLRERFSTDALGAEPLAPDYRGPKVVLGIGGSLGLDAEAYHKLRDAGIANTAELAGTPRSRIEHCLGAAAAQVLRDRLSRLTADEGARTLRDWVAELLAPQGRKASKPEQQVRAWLGLDPLPGVEAGAGARVTAAADVARALGVGAGTVLRNVKQQRQERWRQCAGLPGLVEACTAVVEQQGGACPYADAVAALVRGYRSPGASDDESARDAGALLRLVAELDDERPLTLIRIRQEPWLAKDPDAVLPIERLGERADALAARSPLPSSETVRRELEEQVAGTPLAALPIDRLAQLAVKASRQAAVSSRLELYPRGLAPERALALCASSVLAVPDLSPPDVRERVRARYPEAQPLPERPELDALVREHGFVYADAEGVYRRQGQEPQHTSYTQASSTRLPPAAPLERTRSTPEALEAWAFQETIGAALARGRFRVLKIQADKHEEHAREIAGKLGLRIVSLDRRLWTEVQALCARDEVPLETVLATDRQGPGSQDWHLLRGLMEEAARSVVEGLLRHREAPTLVVHLGALARFRLDGPLHTLAERAEHEEGAAILLLVPAHDDGAAPSINNLLPIPAPLPGQWLRVPRPWLRGEHLAAATDLSENAPRRPAGTG